jgi:quercetin dioxygenase-like cupin family protein
VNASPLANLPGNTLTAVTVELAPGALLAPHTHAGFVFAYVLDGTVHSQLDQGETVEYTIGQSWIEPPGTVHALTQNPSTTQTATIFAVFVAEDGAELTHFEGDH